VGKYKATRSRLTITAALPAPYQGQLRMTLARGAYNGTTIISSVLTFSNGGAPIFGTVVGSISQ
jgi:hypothetical protein